MVALYRYANAPGIPVRALHRSGTIGTVLKAALAGTASPTLASNSPTAPGKPRNWANPDEFMREVALARIYDGVHYRNSTEVGTAMGVKTGELAAAKYFN